MFQEELTMEDQTLQHIECEANETQAGDELMKHMKVGGGVAGTSDFKISYSMEKFEIEPR